MALLFLGLAVPSVFAATSTTSAPVPPNFYVSSNVTSVCKGIVNYVPITVTNGGIPTSLNLGSQNSQGPPMENTELTLVNSKNTYYTSNSVAFLPTINASQSATGYLSWFVPQNASSVTTMQIGINYYYFTEYEDQESRNLSFSTQQCSLPVSLNVSPKILTSGQAEKIQVTLKNNGSLPVSSASVSVIAPSTDIAQLTPMPLQLQSLPPGASATLNDTVYVSKNASLSFPLNVTANYYVNGVFQQVASYRQTLAQGLINLSASSVTVSPSTPSPGGIFSISFVLTDTGTSGASTVSVSSKNSTNFRTYGSTSVFVGSVAAAGQSPVTLTFQASNTTKPGKYVIPVVVNYLDNFRNSVNTTIDVPVSISAAGASILGSGNLTSGKAVYYRSSHTGLGIIVLVLIVAVAVLGFLYYKERKKRRHQK